MLSSFISQMQVEKGQRRCSIDIWRKKEMEGKRGEGKEGKRRVNYELERKVKVKF